MPKQKKKKNINIEPVFRIFCEGEKTEPYYIRGYIDQYHSDKKSLVVIQDTNKNTPIALVDEAVNYKRSGNVGDVYWVVFDREAVSKYDHAKHLEARQKAKSNGIEIAFSDVCFEVWVSLHLTYSASSYSCCDDLLKNNDFRKSLKSIGINNYDKGLPLLFNALSQSDGVNTAIQNAEKINKTALNSAAQGMTAPHYLNPYTDVHELLIDMKMFIDGQPSIRKQKPSNFLYQVSNMQSNSEFPHPF